MVLVNGLGIVDASKDGGYVELRNANQGLNNHEDVGDEPKDGVRGLKVGAVVINFVIFDDDESSDEREKGSGI